MKLNDPNLSLPPQQVSIDVLLEKYAKGDEQTVEEVRRRVARALAAVEKDPAKWEPAVLRGAGERLHPGRAHQLRGRHAAQRHADQLLRAAGRRLGVRDRGRQARHLRRADGGGRNHAPRRRRGLRLLLDPPERRAGARHAEQRQRSGVVHARVRPELRDGGVGRLAARRADGHPALRPPGRRRLHPRQGPRRSAQLQRERRGDRRLHARGRRPTATGSWCTSRRRAATTTAPTAAQRADGLWVYRTVKARDLWQQIMQLDLRPRRAGRDLSSTA